MYSRQNSLVWRGRESNRAFQTRSKYSTTRLPRWSRLTEISYRRHNLIISCRVTLFWQRVHQLSSNYPLCMSSIWQGNFNLEFQIFGLTRPGIEPRTSLTRTKFSTTSNIIRIRQYTFKHYMNKREIHKYNDGLAYPFLLFMHFDLYACI